MKIKITDDGKTITIEEVNEAIRQGCDVWLSNGECAADGVTATINGISYKVVFPEKVEITADDLIHDADDKIKIGDTVYEYTLFRSPECVKPDEVVGITQLKGMPTEYKLKKGGYVKEGDVYKTRAELVERLIREENKRHFNYIYQLLPDNTAVK